MDEIKLTDESQLSTEEAQAIVGLWSLQQRLGPHIQPTVAEVSEGLSIPKEEVLRYLRQVRSSPLIPLTPKRTKKQDIRLAMLIVFAMFTAIWVGAALISFRRNASYAYALAPVPSFTMENGMTVIDYRYRMHDAVLRDMSRHSNRYVFAVDSVVFRPSTEKPIAKNLVSLERALKEVVGGPLADESTVSSASLDPATIERALSSARQDPYSSPIEASYELPSNRRWVEWKDVRVAIDGKEVKAQLPFARVSQKELRNAVEARQNRLIRELAEGALELSKRPAKRN